MSQQTSLVFTIKKNNNSSKCIEPKSADKDRNIITRSKSSKRCISKTTCEDSDDVSPTKSRHGSVLENPSTPSQWISRLNVKESENKDRKHNRSRSTGEPRKLFQPIENHIEDELHDTFSLPGREKQIETLEKFVHNNLRDKHSASLYISGPPGSGKTATINLLLSQSQIKRNFNVVYLNCAGIKSCRTIYERIAEELGLNITKKMDNVYVGLTEFIERSSKMILLVLDELDELKTRKQTVLYRIFEWPCVLVNHLLLIGIANSLDLTERTLPWLKTHQSLTPTLMHFPSYTNTEITSIVKDKLQQLQSDNLFGENAIHLLAGKISAVSGDARRALHVVNRLIDFKSKPSDDIENRGKVELKEVLDVINSVYSTCESQALNSSYSLQHKLIICSLALLKDNAKDNRLYTLGKIEDIYKKICGKRNIPIIQWSEFISICELMEASGMFRIQGIVRSRSSKVKLQWDKNEMINTANAMSLYQSIMSDNTLCK